MSLLGLGVSALGAGLGSLAGSALGGSDRKVPVKNIDTLSGIQSAHYAIAVSALNDFIGFDTGVRYQYRGHEGVLTQEEYDAAVGRSSAEYMDRFVRRELAEEQGTPGFTGSGAFAINDSFGKAFEILSNADNGVFEQYSRGGSTAYQEALRLQGLGENAATSGDLEEEFLKTPGSQFLMEQGQRAIDANASARGLLGSGAQAKELQRFGQGLAATQFAAKQNQLLALAGQGFQGSLQQTQLETQKAGLEVQKGQSLLGALQDKTSQQVALESQFKQGKQTEYVTFEKR